MPRPEVSFHTGGKRTQHNDSYIITDQVYVQYIPPTQNPDSVSNSLQNSIPLLFMHGGGLTGAMWESTPDRRPGWAILASRPPYERPVYCMDAVDSGRSQRCPDSHRAGVVEHRTAADTLWRFRFGPPSDLAKEATAITVKPHPSDLDSLPKWDDSQFPFEHLDRLLASQSARRRGTEQYEAETQGLKDVIAEIGECDIVAHSNGCAMLINALLDDAIKAKIKHVVMVEPGPPYTELLHHMADVKTLVVWGDHFEDHKLWSHTRAHYDKMSRNITVYDLPEMGIKGNTHFPMSDRNSDEVSKLVLDWIQGIEPPKKKQLSNDYFQRLFNASSVDDINRIVYA